MIIHMDSVLMDVVDSLKDQLSNEARKLPGSAFENNTSDTTGQELGPPKVS